MPKTISTVTYQNLLRDVRKTLIDGQARIEKERVQIYWHTGKHIHTHILKHSDRAEYGSEIFKRLENDVKVDVSTLQRCVQFFKSYPKLPNSATSRNFTWSHYSKLITVSDNKTRLALERQAGSKAWSVKELTSRIKETESLPPKSSKPLALSPKPLIPIRGEPYTYQITDRPNIATGKSSLRLDLGFGVFLNDEKIISSFNKGEIVESRAKEESFKLYKSSRTAKDLYTYWAQIERVIDGDTVKVRFDLGFNVEVRETLRLRGLDCPEVDTKEGLAAKAFTASHLKEEAFVIVRSSRSDKYDRYLADVYIPQEGKEEIYLNNLLLENGYAKRMD